MALYCLQFERQLQKCIRMGIFMFKNFVWGGILSDFRSEIMFWSEIMLGTEIMFYSFARASP